MASIYDVHCDHSKRPQGFRPADFAPPYPGDPPAKSEEDDMQDFVNEVESGRYA